MGFCGPSSRGRIGGISFGVFRLGGVIMSRFENGSGCDLQ